jgi:hypothetical protein
MRHVSVRKNVNALSAGGPRTEAGKARSSRNSLRHGLTAKQAVIPGEDQAEFDQLHDDLIADRKPAGELEFQLVAEVAACMWRLARARRHEAKVLEVTIDLYGSNAPKLELVIRYIASIERQLHRTIARLERLQADRRELEAEKPQETQQPPTPLKVMAAGSSFDFTTASDEFVSQSGEFVSQNAETAHDAAAVVRFAS